MAATSKSAMSSKRQRRARGNAGSLERHRFATVVEELTLEPSFVTRMAFGCISCYLDGRLVVVLADRGEPWQGLLVPTAQPQHASLRADLPDLRVHPVLKKWLYLSDGNPRFTSIASALVERISSRDERIGVEPPLPRLRRSSRHSNRARVT